MNFDYLEAQPELGKNARQLRVESGITQEQLANAIGCTRQAIINFESGVSQSMPILQAYIALNELKEDKGTLLLPKGHGRLIDVDDLIPDSDYEDGEFYAVSIGQIKRAATIIEADTPESEG